MAIRTTIFSHAARLITIQSDNNAGQRWITGWVTCWWCGLLWVSVRPVEMPDLVPCPRCLDWTGFSEETILRAMAHPQ